MILPTGADLRSWLPGDNLYDRAVTVPANTPEGEYDLKIGILGEQSDEPKVKLANSGAGPEGWYTMGRIKIRK